jgi:hypothetical protein
MLRMVRLLSEVHLVENGGLALAGAEKVGGYYYGKQEHERKRTGWQADSLGVEQEEGVEVGGDVEREDGSSGLDSCGDC